MFLTSRGSQPSEKLTDPLPRNRHRCTHQGPVTSPYQGGPAFSLGTPAKASRADTDFTRYSKLASLGDDARDHLRSGQVHPCHGYSSGSW